MHVTFTPSGKFSFSPYSVCINVRLLLLLYNNNTSIRVAWPIAEYAYKHIWFINFFPSILIRNRMNNTKIERKIPHTHTKLLSKTKKNIHFYFSFSFAFRWYWWSLHTVDNSNKNDTFVLWLAISNWLQMKREEKQNIKEISIAHAEIKREISW